MAINLCYISFIFDDNLLWHSPVRCTKTLMHLKSDFKPNILWENIVLIIHLKISWRWFITCYKKDLMRILQMSGVVESSIHKNQSCWIGYSCFLHLSLSFPALITFISCCFIRKVLFHDIFHSDRLCEISQWVFPCAIFSQNSVCRKSFQGNRRCFHYFGVKSTVITLMTHVIDRSWWF